jgi:hypothetical protein
MKKQAVNPNKTLLPFFAAALALTFVSAPISIDTAQAQQSVTEQEAHAIGVNAYLYFYPLISMDITRRQSTNVEAGKEILKGPMNTFSNAPAYPPGDLKIVVRINFDTLLLLRLAVSDQRTGCRFFSRHVGALFPPADPRHVDRCLRLAWLADHRDAGPEFSGHSTWLAA